MNKTRTISTVIFFLAVSIVAFPVLAVAAPSVGKVAKATGSATLIRSEQKLDLKEGDEIFRHDRIESHDGIVSIVFVDGSIVRLSRESRFLVDDYSIGAVKETVSLKLISGKLRANVNKLVEKNSRYEISTQNAVAGVRGTDLVVDYDEAAGETRVAFLDGFGEVSLDGIKKLLNANEEIILGPNVIIREVEKIGRDFKARYRELLGTFEEGELKLREHFSLIHEKIRQEFEKTRKEVGETIKKNHEKIREKVDEAGDTLRETARDIEEDNIPKVKKAIKEKVEKIRKGK